MSRDQSFRVGIPKLEAIDQKGETVLTYTGHLTITHKRDGMDTDFGFIPTAVRRYVNFSEDSLKRNEEYTFKLTLPTQWIDDKKGEIKYLYNCRWDDKYKSWEFQDKPNSELQDCFAYRKYPKVIAKSPSRVKKWVLRMKYV